MIARLSYTLCDGDGYACPTGPMEDDARTARRGAKREGWGRRNGKDLCPSCERKEATK